MNLPLVDVFGVPYGVRRSRQATLETVSAGEDDDNDTEIVATIGDARSALEHIAQVSMDNGLGNHIQDALSRSQHYKEWQTAMPSKAPPAILRYQKAYEKSDPVAVSEEVNHHGRLLSSGQFLFHGGLWPGGTTLITERPLSTSLCPQVALRNAEYKAKAYDAGRLDLFLLRVTTSATKAYVFKRKGTKLGHESEVLLAAGARLSLRSETLIRSNYPAAKVGQLDKEIPIFVLELELS